MHTHHTLDSCKRGAGSVAFGGDVLHDAIGWCLLECVRFVRPGRPAILKLGMVTL